MAENDLTTVYLTTHGIPQAWLSGVARGLVAARLAATADISVRPDQDSGMDVMARLHTRHCHLAAIAAEAGMVADLVAYPLECPEDYRDWVLGHTSA